MFVLYIDNFKVVNDNDQGEPGQQSVPVGAGSGAEHHLPHRHLQQLHQPCHLQNVLLQVILAPLWSRLNSDHVTLILALDLLRVLI